LLLGLSFELVPKFIVLFHLVHPFTSSGLSLYLYYPTSMLSNVVPIMSATLAMVADCLPPEHRAAGFAVTLGSVSAGFAIAPLVGQKLGLKGAITAAVVLKGLSLLYTVV
jgi:hypothetical protein